MIKKYVFPIVILIVIIVGIWFVFHLINSPGKPSETKMKEIKDKVEYYLTQEKGYSKEDILSLEPVYNPKEKGTDSAYMAKVKFKDEPEVIYYYGMIKDKMTQQGYSGSVDNPKHEEVK